MCNEGKLHAATLIRPIPDGENKRKMMLKLSRVMKAFMKTTFYESDDERKAGKHFETDI